MATEVVGNYLARVESLTPVSSGVELIQESTNQTLPNDFGFTTDWSWPMALLVIFVVVLVGLLIATTFRLIQLNNSIKLVLMLLLIPVSLVVVDTQTRYQSQAGPDEIPKNVVIYHQDSRDTLVISWETENKTIGGIRLSLNKTMQPIERVYTHTDSVNQHLVEINNLPIKQEYFLEILSEGVWYNHSGKPIEFIYTQ